MTFSFLWRAHHYNTHTHTHTRTHTHTLYYSIFKKFMRISKKECKATSL